LITNSRHQFKMESVAITSSTQWKRRTIISCRAIF